MSNSEGEVTVEHEVARVDASTPEKQVIESSKDSSESSSASGRSRSESGSTTGSTDTGNDQGNESSGEQSDGVENESVATEKSTESYKSMNTSVLKTDVSGESKDLKVPSLPGVKATVKASRSASPTKAEVKTPKAPLSSIEKGARGKSQSMSPVLVTPAKSLVIGESPKDDQSDVEFRSPSGRGVGTSKQRSTPANSSRKPQASPGDSIEPTTVGTQAIDKSASTGQAALERKRSRHPEKAVKKEVQSPKKKRVKKVKDKADRVKEQSRSGERMELQVKQLQAQLNEVVSADRGRNKQVKKDKRKSSKSKKNKNHSSGEVSSQSSSSEEPNTSSRIGKIPTGRRNQRIAMSRSKQLGVIRQGEIHVVEVTEALKIIDKAVFVVKPTHGYKWFNRLPGVELPHIQIHVKELMERMGGFVQATAKLCLEVTHEQDLAKKQRVGPEAENKFVKLWQFANDLSRASAADQQPETAAALSEGPDESKAVDKVAKATKSGDKSASDVKMVSSDQQKEAAVAAKHKVVKKKKSTGAKTEV